MTDKLRPVDRVMLETLRQVCSYMIESDGNGAGYWQQKDEQLAALLTEQPEQDEALRDGITREEKRLVYGLAPEPVEQTRPGDPGHFGPHDGGTMPLLTRTVDDELASMEAACAGWKERAVAAEEKLAKLVGLVKDLCKLLGFYNADVVLRPQAAALFAYLNELEGGE